jgi:SAM-dependent methyltransferase
MSSFLRFAHALTSNQLASLAPAMYVRVTKQTGRGDSESETATDIAEYFYQSLIEYLHRVDITLGSATRFLAGKTVVEYGPGDFPGVAILLVALGARKVYCVDRFPMINFSAKNHLVYQELLKLLDKVSRERLSDLFVDRNVPDSVFNPDRIEYVVRPHGFCELRSEVDLVLSRAVLEHVDDLPGTFKDMVRAMRPDSLAVHLVDLRSHGLHRHTPLDFLEQSPLIWSLMYSHKGAPNRWRAEHYREILSQLDLEDVKILTTLLASQADVAAVRPRLAAPFRDLSDHDIACLGIWITFRKPSGPM